MWLPETAADTATLEALAANGIKFTLLAPHQCKRIRPLKVEAETGEAEWTDTPNASVDTTHPYLVRFASGASIAVFFYDGPDSRAIAFEGLLDSGDNLVGAPQGGLQRFTPSRSWFMWLPMASRTVIITSTAKWRWRMRCD